MDGPFVDRMNQFVFKAALPVLLFEDLANSDFSHVWDTRFVLFCFGVTPVSYTHLMGVAVIGTAIALLVFFHAGKGAGETVEEVEVEFEDGI